MVGTCATGGSSGCLITYPIRPICDTANNAPMVPIRILNVDGLFAGLVGGVAAAFFAAAAAFASSRDGIMTHSKFSPLFI